MEFQNLDIYKLAEKLAEQVRDLVASGDGFAKDTLGKQLVCSADGIGANDEIAPRFNAYLRSIGTAKDK